MGGQTIRKSTSHGSFLKLLKIRWSGTVHGGAPREQCLLDEFRLPLEDYGLMDLGYVGLQHTWWNGQDGGGGVYERLDRMVVNERWMEELPLLCVYHLNKGNSNHFPIKLVEYKRESKKRRRGFIFRFEDFWLTSSMCQEVEYSEESKGKARKTTGFS
ncbi:Acetylglutamate kinase [Bienertia sinuspersici]